MIKLIEGKPQQLEIAVSYEGIPYTKDVTFGILEDGEIVYQEDHLPEDGVIKLELPPTNADSKYTYIISTEKGEREDEIEVIRPRMRDITSEPQYLSIDIDAMRNDNRDEIQKSSDSIYGKSKAKIKELDDGILNTNNSIQSTREEINQTINEVVSYIKTEVKPELEQLEEKVDTITEEHKQIMFMSDERISNIENNLGNYSVKGEIDARMAGISSEFSNKTRSIDEVVKGIDREVKTIKKDTTLSKFVKIYEKSNKSINKEIENLKETTRKLSGRTVPPGFPTIKVAGQDNIDAGGPYDELEFVGSGITITTNKNTKKVTFTSSGGTVGPGTINEIAYFDTANTVASLAVATYPSLAELAYVKGVTSAIQTQIDSKQASDTQLTSLAGLSYTGNALKGIRVNAGETDFELATIVGGTTTQMQYNNAGVFGGMRTVYTEPSSTLTYIQNAHLSDLYILGHTASNAVIDGSGGKFVFTRTSVTGSGNGISGGAVNLSGGSVVSTDDSLITSFVGANSGGFSLNAGTFDGSIGDARGGYLTILGGKYKSSVYTGGNVTLGAGTADTGAGSVVNGTLSFLQGDNLYRFSKDTGTYYLSFSTALLTANRTQSVPDAAGTYVLLEAGQTFTADISVPDEAYDATGWNGNLEVPTKNAIRDKIESMGGGGNVSKVGTPVNNQIAVWTGDGTIEGDENLTYDAATATLALGASNPVIQLSRENQTGLIKGADATTLDENGANLEIRGGAGNGTGSSGSLYFADGSENYRFYIDGSVLNFGAVDYLYKFQGDNANAIFDMSAVNTSDKTFSFPNTTGTVALTSDITLATLGITSTASELNILDGATLTVTELNYVDGVTSAIQTQIDGKQPLDSDLTTIAGLTATTDNFIVSVASAWASRTPAQVRSTLGIGSAGLVATDLADLNEATIEGAIDTLANLVSIQGRTVTLADAGADAIFGWDDSASAYQNLSAADVRTALGLVIGTNVQAYDADLTTWAGITPGTGVGTALAVNVGSAGAFVTFNGALGTPSSGTLTNATGLPAAGIVAGTLTGAFTLSGTTTVNLVLPTADHSAVGPVTNAFASGYTAAAFDLVFLGSGGKWLEVDADAVATCKGLIGIAMEAKNDTQTMIVALPGSYVRDDTWNWTVGATLYAGETLGAIQEAIPTGADAVIKVIGFAVTADIIFFNPSPDQQTTVA